VSPVPAGGQKTKNRWLIRKDEEAVTPVIATILLVTITVLLVSTLYVMVTGLLPGTIASENSVDIAMADYQDGNWTLRIDHMNSPTILAKDVRLTIYDRSGAIKLNRINLIALTMNSSDWNLPVNNWQLRRAVYQCVAPVCSPNAPIRYRPDSTVLSVGDTISVFKDAISEHVGDPDGGAKWWGYKSGYSYSLTYSQSVLLATGTL
jgi:hypothetical protein